jgi:RNA-binding protein
MTDRADIDASPQAVRVPPSLSPAERKALRAAAHHLDPVVMLGDAGVSEAVIAETDRALTAHELIKVRVQGDDRQARAQAMTELCARLGAAAVQSIGKLLVIYRPRPEPVAPRSAPHQPKKRAGEKPAERTRDTSRNRTAKPPKRATAKPSAKPAGTTSARRSAKPAATSSARSSAKPSTKPSARRGEQTASSRREGPAARREGPAARRPASAARKRGSHS